MLTESQVAQDAQSLVEDLVQELRVRNVDLTDQMEILLEAAKVLTTASRVLVKMIAAKQQPTMH